MMTKFAAVIVLKVGSQRQLAQPLSPIQQQIIRLAIAHPFTLHELAQIVRNCSHVPVDDDGIQDVLAYHHLSHEVLRTRAGSTTSPGKP